MVVVELNPRAEWRVELINPYVYAGRHLVARAGGAERARWGERDRVGRWYEIDEIGLLAQDDLAWMYSTIYEVMDTCHNNGWELFCVPADTPDAA